ncbi:MAG: zf-HC2 domain-containing protein [Actinomycetota bacterium]|nr:zf-HC2 domain-containing protein [Actinomycetota bacterium]
MASEHVRWDELAVGYALHALEPADEQAFGRHLAGCAACVRTVAETDGVMTQLAYAAEVEAPPDSLRQSILDGIRTSDRPATFPTDPVVTVDGTTVHAEPGKPTRSPALLKPRAGGRSAGRSRLRRLTTAGAPWAAVAAGLVLVLTLGMWNLVLRSDNSAKDLTAARQQALIRIIEDPATRSVALSPTTPGVRATAFLNNNHLWLLVDGLPSNAPTSTYVLWRDPGAADASAVATFDVARTGPSVVDAGLLPPELSSSVHVLAVTLEKGRTAPARSGTALLTGAVST